jgi:hypothetical protein
MRFRSLALAVAALVVAALATAVAAPAKEGVKATLTSTIPLDASAGTRLRVTWTLRGVDDNGRPYPFGANGVLVRLVSASGADSTTGYAPSGDYANGKYAATVVVPDGGIGDVRIGLRSFTSGANGYHQSDMIFPIANDPMPGPARVLPPGSGSSTTWILVLVAAAAACGLLTVAFRRQRGYAALLSTLRRSSKPTKTA